MGSLRQVVVVVGYSEEGLIGKGDVDVLDSGNDVGLVFLGGLVFHFNFRLDFHVIFGFSQINRHYLFPPLDVSTENIIRRFTGQRISFFFLIYARHPQNNLKTVIFPTFKSPILIQLSTFCQLPISRKKKG